MFYCLQSGSGHIDHWGVSLLFVTAMLNSGFSVISSLYFLKYLQEHLKYILKLLYTLLQIYFYTMTQKDIIL